MLRITSICAVVILGVAGCGSNSEKSATNNAEQAAITNDYDAYWAAFLHASDPVDVASSELTAHATGQELERARTALTARAAAGETVRGEYQHASKVTSVSGDKAELTDCLVAKTTVYDKSGKPKTQDSDHPQSLTVKLERDQQTWKVSLVTPGQQTTCSGSTTTAKAAS